MAMVRFSTFHLILLMSATVVMVSADLQRLEHTVKPDGPVSFLVVGDWGRRGLYNQSNVAYQMGNVGEKLNVDFIVSTGDNFYDCGLVDEDDPAFYDSFTNVYTALSLQKQWYSVLGNHDYRGNALAQLSPVLTQRDNKWLCMRSFILNAGNVQLLFVDTTPFQDKYFHETDQEYDWRGVLPREEYLATLLKDVDVALKESSAKWKIVVGHHTIFSAGVHGNTEELVDKLLPILQENKVNLYINGHDHCLQHITSSDSELQFITSGAGSKAWRGDINPWNLHEMKFYYDGQGFLAAEITENEVYLAFYDIYGNILHKWSTSGNTRSAS
ncbi:purple acid phosphatase 17 [Artemisia annua]|uniref:Purple acid phosphatase n=1 Tax=Artemisia annua TaxID=35608 RepID=A0A2U1MTB5_ARTAN|nr:purple acid phosphatase 17 [Artemisia annua]